MLKTTILVCAICAGAGGTVVWVKSEAPALEAATASMPSIQELHLKANAASLPDRTVRDAF